MRKKLSFAVGAAALTLVLSSCWALQNFTIGDYTLTPGQTTKVKLTMRPMGPDYASTGARQFVIIGVGALSFGQDTDIGVSNAKWAVNGDFGGPLPMGVEGNLVTAMGTDCSSAGLNFADIVGVTWKAFATPTNKNDQGKVNRKSVIQAVLKAKAAQVDAGENYTIMGVAGAWHDDGDGNPEDSGSTEDFYTCWSISTASVHVVG